MEISCTSTASIHCTIYFFWQQTLQIVKYKSHFIKTYLVNAGETDRRWSPGRNDRSQTWKPLESNHPPFNVLFHQLSGTTTGTSLYPIVTVHILPATIEKVFDVKDLVATMNAINMQQQQMSHRKSCPWIVLIGIPEPKHIVMNFIFIFYRSYTTVQCLLWSGNWSNRPGWLDV